MIGIVLRKHRRPAVRPSGNDCASNSNWHRSHNPAPPIATPSVKDLGPMARWWPRATEQRACSTARTARIKTPRLPNPGDRGGTCDDNEVLPSKNRLCDVASDTTPEPATPRASALRLASL